MCILDVKKGDFNKCRTMINRIIPCWEKLIEKKLRISGCSFLKKQEIIKAQLQTIPMGGKSNEEHQKLPVWLYKGTSKEEKGKKKKEKETNKGRRWKVEQILRQALLSTSELAQNSTDKS